VTPCGVGVEPTWSALVQGKSGIGPITLFDASELDTRFAGEVPGFDPRDHLDPREVRRLDRFQHFALAAASMAVEDAALPLPYPSPERAAVLVGSSIGGLAHAEGEHRRALERGPSSVRPSFILKLLPSVAPSQIGIRFGFQGPTWGPNSACATSAHALGEGMRLIRDGRAEVVLAGGADSPICFMAVAGFGALRALSTRNEAPAAASRPFDAGRDGFVLAEGGAVLLLEEWERARARGAPVRAELAGYGAGGDAHHLVTPAPGHAGGARSMRAALDDAGIAPEEIDYVNAHATSTPMGDILELQAVADALGARAHRIPISSTKSMTGHMIGGAGAAEAAFAVLALERGIVPPTVNLDTPGFEEPFDCVPGRAREAEVDAVLTNSFAFGGANATLVFRRG